MRSPDDTVRTMVTKLEQALHRDGWDQPARLFSVWQHREGALRMELVPIPIQSREGEDPDPTLCRMCQKAERGA